MNDDSDTVDAEALAIVRCVHAIEPMTIASRLRIFQYLEERYGSRGKLLESIRVKFAESDALLAKASKELLVAAEFLTASANAGEAKGIT